MANIAGAIGTAVGIAVKPLTTPLLDEPFKAISNLTKQKWAGPVAGLAAGAVGATLVAGVLDDVPVLGAELPFIGTPVLKALSVVPFAAAASHLLGGRLGAGAMFGAMGGALLVK